jgi:hypothetical protein
MPLKIGYLEENKHKTHMPLCSKRKQAQPKKILAAL